MTAKEQKKALIELMNSPMSAEEWLEHTCPNHTEQSKWNKSELLFILHNHANYILSQRIDELAERIAEKAQRVDIQGHGVCDVIDKKEILKIAKDYINELNLQISK